MTQFTIPGNPWLYKYWKKRLEKSQRMVKKYENTVVDIISITMPTASSMLIKFNTTNNGKKYELILQGRYHELYKKQQEGDSVKLEDIELEALIRLNLDSAYQINE